MCRYPESVSHPLCSIYCAVKLGQVPLQIRISKLEFGMEMRDEQTRRAAAPVTASTWRHTVNAIQTLAGKNIQTQIFLRDPKTGNFA